MDIQCVLFIINTLVDIYVIINDTTLYVNSLQNKKLVLIQDINSDSLNIYAGDIHLCIV